MADHKTPLTSYHGGADVIGEGEGYGAAVAHAAYPAIGNNGGHGNVAINMPLSAAAGVISRYNTNNNVRFYYGNDVIANPERDELRRTEELTHLINSRDYSVDSYSDSYINSIKMNNAVYKACYTYFFLFLSYTIGILTAVWVGLWVAMSEFFLLYMIRPGVRMMGPFVWAFTAMSKMLADSVRPLAALMCPWNKH